MSETITIASALRRTKRIKGQIAEHKQRALDGVTFIEGKEPAFDFAESMKTRADLVSDLLNIGAAIARANAGGTVSYSIRGTTSKVDVPWAIRCLEEVRAEITFLRSLPARTKTTEAEVESSLEYEPESGKHIRSSKTTVHVSRITKAEVAKNIADLQETFERINQALEEWNHATAVTILGTSPSRPQGGGAAATRPNDSSFARGQDSVSGDPR